MYVGRWVYNLLTIGLCYRSNIYHSFTSVGKVEIYNYRLVLRAHKLTKELQLYDATEEKKIDIRELNNKQE